MFYIYLFMNIVCYSMIFHFFFQVCLRVVSSESALRFWLSSVWSLSFWFLLSEVAILKNLETVVWYPVLRMLCMLMTVVEIKWELTIKPESFNPHGSCEVNLMHHFYEWSKSFAVDVIRPCHIWTYFVNAPDKIKSQTMPRRQLSMCDQINV